MSDNTAFFAEQSANSEVKMQIVLAAFKLWLSDVKRNKHLNYIDLFCGPGVYDDGTLSTPVCILQEICATEKLARQFYVVLNDNSKEAMARLRRAMANIRNYKYIRSVTTSTNDNSDYNTWPDIDNDEHSFVFLDPFGWKGMNKEYIRRLLNNPNCEMVLLFCFNQFNRFKNYDEIDGIFEDLFTNSELSEIKQFCAMNPGYQNERFILNTYVKSITDGQTDCYVIPFKFQIAISLKTSHYLIFIVRDAARAQKLARALRNFANYKDDRLCYSTKSDAPRAPLEVS
ncbi:MAG: three-Cys-motif partner protein TcmP [Alphaproteobacteria bacterium]|nr:three-Cys-motif partner protein TcmP [Alphaproteobacteria bacterium]